MRPIVPPQNKGETCDHPTECPHRTRHVPTQSRGGSGHGGICPPGRSDLHRGHCHHPVDRSLPGQPVQRRGQRPGYNLERGAEPYGERPVTIDRAVTLLFSRSSHNFPYITFLSLAESAYGVPAWKGRRHTVVWLRGFPLPAMTE